MRKMKRWALLTTREKISRWAHVVSLLRAMTPHERRRHFNMSSWGEDTDCGTVACAAGHACLDPWFNRRGLRGKWRKSVNPYTGVSRTYLNPGDVVGFFGHQGVERIFYNSSARPVGTVIRECLQYIRELKSGEAE